MLYMVIERFKNGNAAPVYQRFTEKGRMMPEGLHYIQSWVDLDTSRCYQLMECEDPGLLTQWTRFWDDLVDFEITPVKTSSETVSALGMKKQMESEIDDSTRYVVLLTKVPGAERNDALMRRHVEYLRALERRGKLDSCGPFLDFDGGMIVLKASSINEARDLAEQDPFVHEGGRSYEVRTWKLSCEGNNHLGMG